MFQADFVDHMIYGLRGYHSILDEEMRAIYRNNQELDGRLNGNANWGTNSPGMLYGVAEDYRLSHDRKALDELMPQTLKALDWCIQQLRRSSELTGPAKGLYYAPANDGTGDGVWAFNQAYMYAGLEGFGRVLQDIGHPRAKERWMLPESFTRPSSVASDRQRCSRLWCSCETTHGFLTCLRRLLPRAGCWSEWYPTDADAGALHLIRLKAIPASGNLATDLLNDQEDNLYFKGWGMTDEPVYFPAYQLRDEPKAAIRDFYSLMTSGFSHTALEPLEHRWLHGQYFCPPGTDGAWFDLYRHMLINELEDGTLFIAEATPRPWLEDGKRSKWNARPPTSGTCPSHWRAGLVQGRFWPTSPCLTGATPRLCRFASGTRTTSRCAA